MIEWNRRETDLSYIIMEEYYVLDSNLWNLKYFSSLAMQCPNYRNSSDALKTEDEI